MDSFPADLTPDEIRAIRERLGLTQIEASKIIGGGRRSFTKYESGAVKPAAAVVRLLRLIEEEPAIMAKLRPGYARSTASPARSPFEVDARDIAALGDRWLPQLLRRLLSAEALAHGLPAYGIHVASNINAPDGGEDGRIEWTGGPPRTSFLRRRLNQFQSKAGPVAPAQAAADVIGSDGKPKEMVSKVLEADGTYIMVCGHAYDKAQVDDRANRIGKALRETGLGIYDDQVEFRDADQLADWANRYPTVAAWVREHTQPGLLGPFRSWSHWAGRVEHDRLNWIEDERLPALRQRVRESAAGSGSVVRLLGQSGIGSSRLVLEAFAPTEEEEAMGVCLCDQVMYAVLSETSPEIVIAAVQRLVDSKTGAVIVVDHCEPETHRTLAGAVSRPGSRVALVTVDYDLASSGPDEAVVRINNAPESVTEGIIAQVAPGLSSLDQRRLARFARGYPKIASRIAQVWGSEIAISNATDADLVDAFVKGRDPLEPVQLMATAQLVAVFGLMGVEPPMDDHLDEVARLARGLSADDLYDAVVDLVDRGVVQRRGRTVILQPRPIALHLASRQWKRWRRETRVKVLVGDTSPGLKVLAARQLALLDAKDVAGQMLDDLCRPGGPLDSWESMSADGHPHVLSALAEIDPRPVVDLIDRVLAGLPDLTVIAGDARRQLVVALERTAFDPATFKDSARLLLRLALAENEMWANNATGQFAGLFPMILGGTAADGETRLELLKEAAATDDALQQKIVVNALNAGMETFHFGRVVGAEIRGSRPSLESWRPATDNEATKYVAGCVRLLCELALEHDAAGEDASEQLGASLYGLTVSGLIDVVEEAVHQMMQQGIYWPRALVSLRDAVGYHGDTIGQDTAERVIALIAGLEPKTLKARIRSLVTESPWSNAQHDELDPEERMERHAEELPGLADELLDQPADLLEFLPRLSCGQHAMAFAFGQKLAHRAERPLELLTPIMQCTVAVPMDERNYDLLSGFLTGLTQHDPAAVESFKREAASSADLAPILPPVCSFQGISESDVQLAIDALQDEALPPWRLNRWSLGGVLSGVPAKAVASLLNAMFDHSADGFAEGVELMGMYAYSDVERLEAMRPEVLRVATKAVDLTLPSTRRQNSQRIDERHFNRIMDWMLSKGREDSDAVSTGLVLAKGSGRCGRYGQCPIAGTAGAQAASKFPGIRVAADRSSHPIGGRAPIFPSWQRPWRFELSRQNRQLNDFEPSGRNALCLVPGQSRTGTRFRREDRSGDHRLRQERGFRPWSPSCGGAAIGRIW